MSFENVEDVYALAPTQQGLLVHCLEEPESDVYVSQLVATLGASLDLVAFRAAWDALVARHAVLRTAFLWDGLDEPLQVVRETVSIEWTIVDEPTDAVAWAERLAADRARGLDLDRAPLVRMTLARVPEGGWHWVWTFHHLILDGWSARLLLDELRAVYAGDASALDPPFPYRAFIAWHAERDPAEGEAFWRRELAGLDRPTRLDLPPASGRGSARVRRVLPATLGDALTELARRYRLTVATVVQGAWAIVAGRLAREDDVVCGVTQALRPPELDGVERGIGLFIGTVPLRARLDPAAPVGGWLQDLQRRQVEARRFASTPLATIQRVAELPAGVALFDHLLVIESHPDAPDTGPPELACDDLDIHEHSHYPLAVLVLPGARPELLAVYDRARVATRDAERLLDHLATVLSAVAEAPETPIGEIALADEGARRRTLVDWNDPWERVEPVAAERIDARIARVAREHGDRDAVVCGDDRLTYREVLGRADPVAAALRARGVTADVPVGLVVERSVELIVGVLAILRAGGAYVPIDPAYPAAHQRRVLDDVEAPVVLGRGLAPDELADLADAWLDLDSVDRPSGSALADPPIETAPETAPEHLAYILYTSGSTGEPKGVMVEHRQLVRSTAARETVYPESVGRFLLLSSIAFDSSVAGLFWTLGTGGTLVLPRDDEVHDLDRLLALIASERVTHTLALPAFYRLLLDGDRPGALGSLDVVVVAGEACPPELVERHRRTVPGARLVNEYGPTEGTVWTTAHELGPADGAGPVPIGRPIPGARVAVVDHHGRPAPVGVAGELLIAGDGVARGYWRRPDETAERFVAIDVPEWGGPTRVYRSGDLVRWRDDGALVFLGRVDEQVKIRGHRVELAGVEALLTARPEIAEAAVGVEQTAVGGARLVAWTVAASADHDVDTLGEALRADLPEFLVPDRLHRLDALPRRPNGKVDRRRLGELATDAPARPESAPRDPIETTIAAVWSQVLGVDSIASDDDFVGLGGDSILGIQVVSRLRQEGLPAEPRDLARHRTLGALADALRERRSSPREPVDPSEDDGTGEVPLLPLQSWFFARDLPAPHHWNLSARFEVAPGEEVEVTAEHLGRALAACLERHEALRARFTRDAGSWRQHIPEAVPEPSELVEVVEVADATERRRAVEATQAGLSLERGLVRSVLIESSDEVPRQWLIAAHHLVVDVVSWAILADDLELALAQALADEPIVLPPRSASLKRWAEHVASRPAAPAAKLDDDADPESGRLPLPEARGAEPLTEGGMRTHHQILDRASTGRLLAALGTGRVGLDRLLLAAVALTLAPWRESPRLRLAIERHGRESDTFDLSRTVGWLTVSEPVTITLRSLDPAPAAALDAARDAFEARPASGPEPELLLNVLGRRPAVASASRLRPIDGGHEGARDPRQPRSHRLELNARIDGDRLRVDWIHGPSDIDPATIDELAQRLAAAVDRLAGHLLGASPLDALGWSADDLARLGDPAAIEDVHPLSTAQEALLVHRLQDPEYDTGVVLLRARLLGPLDVERWVDAWRATVARHPVLRSAVRWRGLPSAVQVVARRVEVPIAIEDWRDRSTAEQDAAWAERVDALRRAGLDLETAPVLSVFLARVGKREYRLAWACHHVLLDGWSSGLVLREVVERARGDHPDGPAPPPFREHVDWTRRHAASIGGLWDDLDPRDLLDAPRLVGTAWQGGGRADRRSVVPLRVESAALEGWARRHGVTVASVVLASWGLVLAEATGAERAVTGFTASGRGLDLDGLDADGVDRRIGLFAGVLPLLVEVDREAAPAEWIRGVFERQQATQPYAAWPLRQLFEAAGTALRRPPFDTLVAVANFPVGDAPGDPDALRLDSLRGDLTAALPLTLAWIDDATAGGVETAIEARWDAHWHRERDVVGWVERLAALVEVLVADDLPSVGAWLSRAPGEAPPAARSTAPARAVRPLGGTGATSPTTPTEAQLMRLWNDLLAVQEYGVDDNFFDLGGHSLHVPRMLARIAQDFGVELPLGAVFENATVRSLAARIDARGDRDEWSVLVPIREGGSAAPLFMVHGLGGEVGWFYDLANGLDPEVPLHGLQAPPEPLDQLDVMAARYVEAARAVQPSGPYRLGGYCIGGGVAFEMARQLRAAGETVSVLVLVDSVPQAHIAEQQAAPALGRRLARLLSKDPAEIVRSTRDAARRAGRRLVARARAGAGGGAGERPLELDDVLDMDTLPAVYHEVSRRHFRAMRDYRPGPYDGDAWLLRTADERFGEDFGWGELVRGRLTVERVPGRHVDVLKEPHVQVVGRLLNAILAEDRGGDQSGDAP